MITPSFKLEQDDGFLIITIRAPYTNVRNAEVAYDGGSFLFSSKPYFLRLFLPCDVVDDESGTSDYDAEMGIFTIKVPKRTKGEHFPKLELLSELLAPQKSQKEINAQALVEELPSSSSFFSVNGLQPDEGNERAVELGEHGDELYAEQCLNTNKVDELDDTCDEACRLFGYGFAWRRHGVFVKFSDEIGDFIDLKNSESTLIEERVELCRHFDAQKFDSDYYLADLFEPNEYIFPECIAFKLNHEAHLSLTEANRDRLKDLPRRKLPDVVLYDTKMMHSLAFSLLDLLAAYLYDLRVTNGEHCAESSWTIAKLAPSLAFLVRWSNACEAISGFLRRVMVYPLIRHWGLALNVVDDLRMTLAQGRAAILKCLLDIHQIFARNSGGELRYLFNQLFIENYIIWIQCVDEKILVELSVNLEQAILNLNKVNSVAELDLDWLETEARFLLLKMEKEEYKSGANDANKLSLPLDSDDDEDDEEEDSNKRRTENAKKEELVNLLSNNLRISS